MTDTELKKLIEDCCDDIFNRLEPLANVKSRLYESLKTALIIDVVLRSCLIAMTTVNKQEAQLMNFTKKTTTLIEETI